MTPKRILPLLVVAALMPLASVVAITHFRGTSVEAAISGIAVLTVYAFMFASYLARFAVAVLGVFAIYKVLWERVNGRMENRSLLGADEASDSTSSIPF